MSKVLVVTASVPNRAMSAGAAGVSPRLSQRMDASSVVLLRACFGLPGVFAGSARAPSRPSRGSVLGSALGRSVRIEHLFP
ncbi:hypothetical protein ASE09_13295 [Streptomyces sp. Root66D1]|nr:hypothetical protein ASD33_13290 [Streptomyces sp. Root1304]KRA85140.1 hypothetical protein ASE09_13295 [Streptomyces sp. Root66D1]